MTPEQYIQQQGRIGYKIHHSQGVWWQQHGPFYYKPIPEFQEIPPGTSRPNLLKGLAGYSHMVPAGYRSNKIWSFMIFEWSGEGQFSLETVGSKKRNQIRKGLKLNEIKRIEDIGPYLDDLKKINITARGRTGVGKPATYYEDHYNEWRHTIEAHFSLEDREWWGAFIDGKLIAYYYGYQIDSTMIIDTAKTHSDYLSFNPTDALLYSMMEHLLNGCGVRRIVYGGWVSDDQKLAHFKEQFLFFRKDFPVYLHLSAPVRLLLQLKGLLSG